RAALELTAAAEIAARRSGDARGGAGIGARELGDHAVHRPAGRELHHHERYQHDPEQGWHHEHQPADEIGGHAFFYPARSSFAAAACAVKNERSESPGVVEKLNRSTVRSKSKSSRRDRYCTGSTTRRFASRPSVARFLM